MQIAVSKEAILVLIKFRVRGALRFISHAEMLKVFQRACARAGIKIQHSQGFNPRPRLSLPLPRPVGVESDDELLCVWLKGNPAPIEPMSMLRDSFKSCLYPQDNCCGAPITNYQSRIKARLSEQLPEGVELLSVEVPEAKSTPQPRCVTYVLSVRPEYADDRLKATIKHLSERKHIIVERKIDAEKLKIENRKSKIKEVDVRPFLKSIELNDKSVVVKCEFTSAGSIRVDEILRLLQLDVEELAVPVRRTNVQWQKM